MAEIEKEMEEAGALRPRGEFEMPPVGEYEVTRTLAVSFGILAGGLKACLDPVEVSRFLVRPPDFHGVAAD